MSLTESKKTYTVCDSWQAYVKKVLLEFPEYWTRQGGNSMSNFSIHRKVSVVKEVPDYSKLLKDGIPRTKKVLGYRNEEVMNYKRYRKIIENYFVRARKAIIKGEAVNIYGSVGKICARRVERDFRSKHQRWINWPATKKQPLIWNEQQQKMKYKNTIYYTGDSWCRIGWHRTSNIANETTYEFKPAERGSTTRAKVTGFKAEFIAANTADTLLQYQYLFFPIRVKKYKNDIQVSIDKRSDSTGNTQYQATG